MPSLRELEAESIRAFVQQAANDGYLSGRVLDYGCGKQPYRDIVEAAGGEYHGYDCAEFPANVSGENVGVLGPPRTYAAILCTQVLQYIPHEFFAEGNYYDAHYIDGPAQFLAELKWLFRKDGYLVMTYPTNWPEVEPEDLHRFTKAGMERLLTEAGFEIVRHEPRAWFDPWGGFIRGPSDNVPPESLAFGYGVIARA